MLLQLFGGIKDAFGLDIFQFFGQIGSSGKQGGHYHVSNSLHIDLRQYKLQIV